MDRAGTAMLASMTGFGRAAGERGGTSWTWEVRSVNGRGLDLRLRVPGGLDALEAAFREDAAGLLARGNVSATLTLKRDETPRVAPDPAMLEQVLRLAQELATRIPGAPAPRAEALLALPGVLRPVQASADEEAEAALRAEVRAGFRSALEELVQARRAEGQRLAQVLATLIDEIAALTDAAAAEAATQPMRQRDRMLAALADLQVAIPEERLAQEVALLAQRSDVREEIDRLHAHVGAARALLAEGARVGRKLDFLVQEFVREANTLCSKSTTVKLTALGLELKAAIERLREQVQNVE